jgi:hypothetical protein
MGRRGGRREKERENSQRESESFVYFKPVSFL